MRWGNPQNFWPRAVAGLTVAFIATLLLVRLCIVGPPGKPQTGANQSIIAAGRIEPEYIDVPAVVAPAPEPIIITLTIDRSDSVLSYLEEAGLDPNEAQKWTRFFKKAAATDSLQNGHSLTLYKDPEDGSLRELKYNLNDRVAVRGARRCLHLAQQARACLGQPANLRPAIPAVNGAIDKLARLQALKRAGGCGAIEGHVSRKCRLISGSTPGQSGKQTILERGDLEGSAFLLEERDVDLMQPPDQKSRPLPQRPGIAALVHCVPGHLTTLSLPMLHEFDAIYGMIVVI